MKKFFLSLMVLVAFNFVACDDDQLPEGVKEYVVATPLTADLISFKEEAIAVTAPTPIVNSGNIYAYKDYIFVNDTGRGLHVLDYSNPTAPKAVKFIKLEGNHDIAIKDDLLYADSYGDLVIIDISDLDDIGAVTRIENAIYEEFWCTVGFDVAWPKADIFDYGDFDSNKDAIVGWETKTVRLSDAELQSQYGHSFAEDAVANASPRGSTTGQGGSMARFRIVGNYLYAVEWASINVFDITNLEAPKVLDEVYVNGAVETIFNQGNLLFLGGTQGMYIYDISTPATPTFVSEFEHGRACDPVVVDGDYAYVTLRSGNACGTVESGLYIVDISNLSQPELKVIYPMDEPYGLGVKGDQLFICDGASGLKVYDKSAVPNLSQLNHFKDIVTFDVIPLQDHLLMVGDGVLYQYQYLEDDIRLISQLDLRS